ncbi:MAG: biopolymer transporter ExbD [Gemmatimonadota bacterium]
MNRPGEFCTVVHSPNITPMIDVMLVLLVIFMVVTPLIRAEQELPRAVHVDRLETNGDLTLRLDRGGTWLAGRTLSREQLASVFKRFYGDGKGLNLLVEVDRHLPFGAFDAVAHAARAAGVTRITIVATPIEK